MNCCQWTLELRGKHDRLCFFQTLDQREKKRVEESNQHTQTTPPRSLVRCVFVGAADPGGIYCLFLCICLFSISMSRVMQVWIAPWIAPSPPHQPPFQRYRVGQWAGKMARWACSLHPDSTNQIPDTYSVRPTSTFHFICHSGRGQKSWLGGRKMQNDLFSQLHSILNHGKMHVAPAMIRTTMFNIQQYLEVIHVFPPSRNTVLEYENDLGFWLSLEHSINTNIS